MFNFKSELLRRLFRFGLKPTLRIYRDEYLYRNIEKNLESNNDLITLYNSNDKSRKNIFIRYENQFARKNVDNPFISRGYQYKRCRKIAYKLILKGNNVDVSGYDYPFKKGMIYDHVISNFSGINPPKAKLSNILIFSTAWPKFNNTAELKRIKEFNSEFGVKFKQLRKLPEIKKSDLNIYDDIYLIGNEWTLSTYPKSIQKKIKIIPNQPSFFSNELIKPKILKNKQKTRFIFFGSSKGLIHKGLDLVIRAINEIKNDELELLILGKLSSEKEIVKVLEKLILKRNIQCLGWINVGSQEFIKIFKNASFCILPTCSEGQSESLLNCMANGVIPITTKMSGIDLNNKCIKINNNLKSVKSGILGALTLSDNELYSMRINCIEYVNKLRILSNNMENDIVRNM